MSVRAKLARYYRALKYRGNKYICPICNFKARCFLSSGLYVKRANSKCPSCNSLERHRHLWLFLSKYLEDKKPKNILHFAPENCLQNILNKRTDLTYYTSDYDPQRKSNFHFDIQNIDNKNRTFDLIICSHVLEHIPDDRKGIEELYRVLNPGGIALIQVPIWPSEKHLTYENPDITDPRDRIIHFGQFDHLRIYGLDVIERIEEGGFKVEVLDMEKIIPEEMAIKYRLHNNLNIRELTFACYK
jgi:SAM-dependent methyltransferase